MNKKHNPLKILLVIFSILLLYGCGASSPTGNSGPTRQSQTAVPNITGGNALNMTVYFPVTSSTTPAALISASTSYFEIWVRDNVYTLANNFVGNTIGYAKVVSPVGGGAANIKVDLNPYAGPGTVEVWGFNTNGNGNSFMWNNTTILAANNPSLSIVVVEMGQGVNVPAGSILTSPDNIQYPITKIFVDTSNRVGVQGYYELGIQTTIPGSTSAGVFASSRSSIPGGVASFWGVALPDFWAWGTPLNPYQLQADIVDGQPKFYVDVPNATKKLWSRYEVVLNFQPGGTPTNTPTITTTFRGVLDANAIASTGAGIITNPASGTVILNIPAAAWTNNVAPPPNAQGIVLF